MSIAIVAKGMDDIPEVMREFVTESDGAYVYDEDKAFKALKEEREGRRTDRKELAVFKALGASADTLGEFVKLGKTPAEILEVLNNSVDGSKLTEAEKGRLEAERELRTMRSELETLKAKQAEADRIAADVKLRTLVEGLLDQLPSDQDKEKHRTYLLGGKTPDGLDLRGVYKDTFSVNAIGDLEDVNGKSPLDYLVAVGNAMNFKKNSTAGIATPGNANLPGGNQSAAYSAAKAKGDIGNMLANAPEAN